MEEKGSGAPARQVFHVRAPGTRIDLLSQHMYMCRYMLFFSILKKFSRAMC
jgi:hypothetical protein